jgi:putative hydroxymethylpyrimidine transport system substrate-binding protein
VTRSAFPAAAAALLLGLCLLAAGCGEKRDPVGPPPREPFDLVLDYFPNADHVGVYAALADGEFSRMGLDVRPRTPSDPAAPLKLLAAGRADLAISYEPELLLARDRGLKLVSVGAVVQKPLTSIISIGPRAIGSPAQLRNKRVGTAGIPYQEAYLRTVLERAEVNPASVRQTDVGFNLVPAMLSRRVDATLGAFWNYEGVQLTLQRRRPSIIRIDEVGVPTYNELILVAREEDLHRRGARVRRFLRALSAGYQATRRNPARAVDQLVRANPDLDRRLQLASVRATLPVFFPDDEERPFGYMDPDEWAAYEEWMRERGLIKQPPGRAPLTNEFLPGEGLDPGTAGLG